ncbi:MAG TPA: NAD(P)-dependent oxidoreductase [Burkholderiaceae bacterium]|nr:NAD(P)-dependent oxidoreductase [Burkholderiaceae bacterium]
MKILVTGSAGHLGEALVRSLENAGHEAIGLDVHASPYTRVVGSIADRGVVRRCMAGIGAVLHTATLHKPHVATHTRQDFVDTNITGSLHLLEEAAAAGVRAFVFTSTTSVFGHALSPGPGQPAVWVTEDLVPVPKNIYGVSKLAAENLCELLHRQTAMPCIVLRTSRFFPESDDEKATRQAYADANVKVNEFLFRRVELEDVVSAHLLAIEKAPAIGFGRYIVSATTPFGQEDLGLLPTQARAVVQRQVPDYEALYARRGWQMFPGIERVYVNARARAALGWQPRHDFASMVARLQSADDYRSPLARSIGIKGYHREVFADGPYPIA